jgi:large subunit ribosomal protein L3
MKALIGKKVGMTQVFAEDGTQVPVTVIQVGPCVVVQRKTEEKDGYDAVQLGYEEQKEHRLTQPMRGHFKKAGATPQRVLQEVRLDEADGDPKEGDTVTADIFSDVAYVDISGISKGRGFQGVVKRWNMSGGRASHGSGNHRRTGSIGQCEFPARVMKGRKMPGQMGNRRVTTQNLKVVQVRPEEHAILVRGSVPGPSGGVVFVRKSIKKAAKAS